MSKIIFTEEGTKPPAPASGQVSMYVKTDEVLYIQDSVGVEIPLGSATSITSLTGDVTASGPGAAAATVVSVGGSSAYNVHSAELAANAATSSNTPNTIIKRNGSGGFSAGTITANLTGNVTGNVTGTLTGNVIGTASGNLVPVQNIVVVQQAPSATEFSSIAGAMASITTASSSNPFVISVGPGVYLEPQIVMKSYVAIIGEANSVIVTPSNPSIHLFVGASNATIENIIITGVTGSGQAGIYNKGNPFYILECTFTGNSIGLWCDGVSSASATFFNSSVFSANTTNDILVTNNGNPSIAVGSTCIVSSSAIASFNVSGVGSILTLNATASMGVGSNVGFTFSNGALLEIFSCALTAYNQAVVAPNTGAASKLTINGTDFDSNTIDVQIDHISTVGTIQGTLSDEKSTFVTPSNFALLILDPDGEIITSGTTKTEQIDGVFTDTSTLALEAASMGVLDGGIITSGGGFLVNVSSGFGYLDTNGSSLTPGSIHRVDWPNSSITLTANSSNYLYFNSSAVLTANPNFPDTAGNILLGRVITNSSTLDFIDSSPFISHHYGNSNDNFIREALGPVFSFGCEVTENITPLHLDVTSGSYYFGNNNFLPSSGTNITFQTFYQNGSGGWIIGSAVAVDTNNYDDGSGVLQPIPSNQYARHTLYLVGQGSNKQYLFVYAQTTYASLVLAQTGNIPIPPNYFTDGVVLIASLIVKQGASSIVAGGGQIVDNRPRIGFATPAVEAVGTVTSVALLDGSSTPIYNISGSPITSAGTLTFTLATQPAHYSFLGPLSGGPAEPTFRAIDPSDIPTLNQNTTGSAATVSGTNVITNTNLSQMPADTLKGNNTGSTANAADLTVSQVNTMLGTVTTVGTIDGNGASANGLSILGNTLYAQSASSSNPGMVNNTTQTFSGNKTFSGHTAVSNTSTTALTVNSTSFIFDATNNALGIGIQPDTASFLDGVNSTAASKALQLTGYGVGSTVGTRGRFARGTSGSPAAAQNGDIINFWSARGYGISQFAAASTAAINAVAGETFTNTSNLTYLTFTTTPTGSVTSTENMRVASTGVTIGPQSSSTAIHNIKGGMNNTIRTITGNLTVDTTTADYIIFCNASGAITVTLPTPTVGRTLLIKDISGTASTNNITIARHASETIEGLAASYVMQVSYQLVTLVSDGTNWWVL